MTTIRMTATAGLLALALAACAQGPAAPGARDHFRHHPPGTAPAERMALMDTHMKAMREMHEKMARAGTPEERQALMAEHQQLMREGMALMGGMGPMAGMGGMGGMRGMGPASAASAPMDMAVRQQMMEKRMEMMQSMMQMMMDRMAAPASRP